MRRRQQLILCLVVAGVAAFFRFYRIDAIPPGLFIDEAQDGLDAHVIQTGERFPVFIEGGAIKGRGREPLFHYLMAGMFVLRGPTTKRPHSLRARDRRGRTARATPLSCTTG